ncbi:hypothetical protein GCM10009736_76630 [Actinomadura bangladeshensis]
MRRRGEISGPGLPEPVATMRAHLEELDAAEEYGNRLAPAKDDTPASLPDGVPAQVRTGLGR